ncbi:FAD:protein FMN transferase [Sphingomonas sp. BK580]|uniref:FAD:protein FMN transferase n=1 Tax=Sphingomonas sp. BK580 TaxID=2586972 RepID=UPI00160CC9E2|nr:FAD:protein FMN transferase [Sphingomonas sp. BK580]MBB3693230.1 thiamine biosynthesis lipoprotein ApbE [Sphingomonas sp. BK580]
MSEVEASVARFAAMGTRVELHLFGRAAPDALAAARAAVESVEDSLTVRRESPAVALNRALARGGETVVADPLLWETLLAVDAMWRATGGLFDPGVGGDVSARGLRDAAANPFKPVPRRTPGPSWEGFGGSCEAFPTWTPASAGVEREGEETISRQRFSSGDGAGVASSSRPPSQLGPGLRRGTSAPSRDHITLSRWSALRVDRATRRVGATRPLALDFGGFGKGYALDRAAAVLRAAGVTSAFLSAGESSIAVIGEHPLGGGWPLAIPHPEIDGVWLTELELTDASLSVSSTVGAGAAKPGRAAMVRPTDGAIVTRRATAVAVAATGAEAEALSTALLVADAPALARLRADAPDRRFLFSHDAPTRADRPMELTA